MCMRLHMYEIIFFDLDIGLKRNSNNGRIVDAGDEPPDGET